jgi:hypothetical protein
MANLDIFEHRFGDETHPGALSADGDNSLGQAGLKMLDAIQTVVDVLSDKDASYKVGFANTSSAFTDHKGRRIVISGLPLTKAPKGTPYRDIAAVLTGFAVHEVGHTKKPGIIDAVRAEWPGKRLPQVLGNVIEDVVLEARTVERYAGLTDVFAPTFEWVARETCPTSPLKWGGSTGHKVNIMGQVVRYRPWVTFTNDAATQTAVAFGDEWAQRITAKTTPQQGVELVRDMLAFIHEPIEDEDEDEGNTEGDEGESQPGEGEGEGEGTEGGGDGSEQALPDEDDDDDDTEGEPAESDDEGDDTEGGSATDAPPIDEGDTEGDDGEGGGGESDGGEDDSESDGEADGEDADGEGKGGHSLDADTMDRSEADKGTNDGPGAGGSGQSISEAGDEDPDDPDNGLDESELDKSFDELASESNYVDRTLQDAVDEERITSRLDAGEHGKMRVIFR